MKKEKIEEQTEETVFTISERQIKGVSQCSEHEWKQISADEAECQRCPTVITFNPQKYKIVNGKLNEQTNTTTSKK